MTALAGTWVDRGMDLPTEVVKRDGATVPFDLGRVRVAVEKCYGSLIESPTTDIDTIVTAVGNNVAAKFGGVIPSVENVQDIVEMTLLAHGEFAAARHYIVYREDHARDRIVIPADVHEAFEHAEKYFPSPLQQFMYFDKYARYNWRLGRRETWIETVDRVVEYLKSLSQYMLDPDVYDRIHNAILNMDVMPSMRLLATAGEAAERNSISIYNCAFLPICDVDAFAEIMLVSMGGCGVGFSVERENVEKFPRIKRQTGVKHPDWVVDDSTEGWGNALRHGLRVWFDGEDVDFDVSNVRDAGSPLKTKGGRASGPEPLMFVLDFCRRVVLNRQGTFLRTLDAHDMACAVGGAAVSGGVRRTAMISLFDYDDSEMRTCKDGVKLDANPVRWNANNSAVWPDEITQLELVDQMTEMYRNHRGEPGIFSRRNANANKPARRAEAAFGSNPCLTGETLIMTTEGPRRIDSLGQPFWAVVDGTAYRATQSWPTGVKEVFKLLTREGYVVRLTEDHKIQRVDGEMVPAGELVPGDRIVINNHRGSPSWGGSGTEDEGYLLGLYKGDGTGRSEGGTPIVKVWNKDDGHETVMARALVAASSGRRSDFIGWRDYGRGDKAMTLDRRLVDFYGIGVGGKPLVEAIEITSAVFQRGFLQGLFDADGHVEGWQEGHQKGATVRLSQSDREALVVVQRMLLRFGVRSCIYLAKDEGEKMMPDGRCGSAPYHVRASWRLVISADNVPVFAERIGFIHREKAEKLDKIVARYRFYSKPFVATVEDLASDGKELVYDLTVDTRHAMDANGLVVSNCGEINLRPYQFCNLSIAVARIEDDYDSLKNKVEIATIIGTIQSMATHFPGLRPEWKRNCEKERLLGVDISGQQDCPYLVDAPVEVFDDFREHAIRVNATVASRLGITPSAAITCNKPNGNSSQLLNCASGIHVRWAPYYIRNVRVSPNTPIFRVLKAAGVPMDPENGQNRINATSWVIHFPVKSPEGAKTRKDQTALEQCEWWLRNKMHWTEHNPSVTITYQPSELLDLMHWVWNHRDVIGGMAFLPADDAQYAQMPYEEITKEEYDAAVAAFPEIDFALIYAYEHEDMTTAASELACMSGECLL